MTHSLGFHVSTQLREAFGTLADVGPGQPATINESQWQVIVQKFVLLEMSRRRRQKREKCLETPSIVDAACGVGISSEASLLGTESKLTMPEVSEETVKREEGVDNAYHRPLSFEDWEQAMTAVKDF